MTTSRFADWKRFRLRTLLLLLTAFCLVLGLLFGYLEPYRQQARSMATLIRLQGEVATEQADGPAWLRWLVTKMLGPNSFVRVTSVKLKGVDSDDDVMHSLAGLAYLRELSLERSRFTDEGAAVLPSLSQLDSLSLKFTNITDHEAKSLEKLAGLKTLYLTSTNVSDAAVPHLAKLHNLEALYIRWTHISESGAQQLRDSLPGCDVYYYPLAAEPVETMTIGSR